MNYCSHCGSNKIVFEIPEGDNRKRYCCANCHTIHYRNPHIVVGTLPVWKDQVLLCKRAIEPRKEYWTLPAGFFENGETLKEGARRETREEACADVSIQGLYTVFSLPHINQVYVFYRANLRDGKFAAGDETLEAKLFDEATVPWKELAFPVVRRSLQLYFNDRKSGSFPTYNEIVEPLAL